MIIRPDRHVVAKIGKFLGDSTNNVAEYMGLILGLRRVRHIPREEDAQADAMSNRAIDERL